MPESGGNGRRGAALAAALLVHVLIVWILLRLPTTSRHPGVLEPMTLLYLSRPPQTAAVAAPSSGAPGARRRSRNRSVDVPGPRAEAAPNAAAQEAAEPPIDWTGEQQREAESQGSEIWKRLSQHCRDANALHIYPPECHRYIEPDPWDPEEKRFGLAGPLPLPYVRLGRCVLGLGFWGCAVGRRPPPNGHLFDGMRDPDRPGSIPDNGSYQAPPEPREPLH